MEAGKAVFSIFETGCLNQFWINLLKIRKHFRPTCQLLTTPTCAHHTHMTQVAAWAPIMSTTTACATPAWPRSPPGRPSSSQQQKCRPSSRRAFKAFTHPRAFTSAPIPHPYSTPSACLTTPLCSTPVSARAAEAINDKPRLSRVGVHREHLPYPISPFEQGLAARSTPPPGSRVVSAAVTLPPVMSSATRCTTFLVCARTATHSPIAYCPGFASGKPPPLPHFKLLSLPPPSIWWALVSSHRVGPQRIL
jgi:hypothetical protein